jgi:hypothetical protein
MKIQVIKAGAVNSKPMSYCDALVDDVPLTNKQK